MGPSGPVHARMGGPALKGLVSCSALKVKSVLKGSSHTLQALHTLSISQSDVGTVAINGGGEWLAFGAAPLGQLLVWEWQSETYVLKQQGHSYDINDVAFSPDGQSACVLRRYRELS